MQSVDILWFKKNLRIDDNQILSLKEKEPSSIGVFFFEPNLIKNGDFGIFHLQFLLESLTDLEKSLDKLGIPLLYIPLDADKGFEKLSGYFDIKSIFSHEETGNYTSYMRDLKVHDFGRYKNIPFIEFPNNGVVRRLKTRNNWSKIWEERMTQAKFQYFSQDRKIDIDKKLSEVSQKTFQTYSEKIINKKNIQKGGESEGKKVLKDFLENRGEKYMYNISKPYESMTYCSRLSPYITFGCLSIKTIYHETYKKIFELKEKNTQSSKNFIKSLRFFLARIAWQSHFIQKLEDQPKLEWKNLYKGSEKVREEIDEHLIEKIFTAQSGVPYIDATIRQLNEIGWCNFRSRAILVSFLSNTCMQPWQAFSHRLAKLFLDYEPGIHYMQLQMQAATTGINTIRIYNPIKNGQEKDVEGIFIKKYIPELQIVPSKYIHEPHTREHFDSLKYPKPIVDVQENNAIAREILWGMKKQLSPEEKKKIVEKHASRKRVSKKKKQKKEENTSQTSLFT